MNATLKKLGVTNIPGIEEANMFKDNGEVIHFKNPKGTYVQAGRTEAYFSWGDRGAFDVQPPNAHMTDNRTLPPRVHSPGFHRRQDVRHLRRRRDQE